MFTLFLSVLYIILRIYILILGIDIILSWFPNLYEIKLFRIIHQIANFYLEPFHGYLVLGPIDLTPAFGIGLLSAILFIV